MAVIADAGSIAAKWARVTPLRAPDYEAGVRAPRVDWAQATGAAHDAWKAGIAAAVAAGSWAKGVSKAGTSKWQEGAISKGVPRWGQGVAIAESAFQAGIAPFVEAIKGVNLPPRYARRDPRNLERVRAIVDALVAKKKSLG